MAYNFKNLNEVDRQDKPTENTTVMAFESGHPKQIPASEFGGKGLVVDLRGYMPDPESGQLTIEDMNYDPIYEAIAAGQHVVLQLQQGGVDIFSTAGAAGIIPGTGCMVLMLEARVLFTNGSYHTTA